MTCEGISGFEFLERPVSYPREPFQLASGELVGFEGQFYSTIGYALLLDLRLMTVDTSHPVTNPFKLYVNKNTGLTISIEPRTDASGYENGTPHYNSYILDMRDTLEDVTALHAADSDHSATQFLISHLARNRAAYDLDNTSASGIGVATYVHSTSDLGASGMYDIDLDEVMWQPFTRPKNIKVSAQNIPIEPVFPAVIRGSFLPSFSILDDDYFGQLGYGANVSGGLVITGDRLEEGTSIKLLTASGQIGAEEGDFIAEAEWALFPSRKELCRYYETHTSGVNISAHGRQAVYNIPIGTPDRSVLLLDVSEAGSSGLVIQTYPINYASTSGVRPDNFIHNGVHNTTKLLYNINNLVPGLPTAARSPINGKIVFGHVVDPITGSKGQNASSMFTRYVHDDAVYGYGGITKPRTAVGSTFSEVEWATTDNLFSPMSWDKRETSALQPAVIGFSQVISVTYDIGDINFAPNHGVVTRKVYAQNGYIDQVVFPDQDQGLGGQRTVATITYETHTYHEGSENGQFVWVEDDGSPTFSTIETVYFADTYYVDNVFSFFFFRNNRKYNGWVNVNGNIYFQWSENSEPVHKFAPLGARTTLLYPSTNHSSVITSTGFFPNWKLKLTVTTNNQVEKPVSMVISPSNSSLITFAPELGLTISAIADFGPPVWDPENNINYIYFRTDDNRFFFAKMTTGFVITEINRVAQADAILIGRMALLST